MGALQKVVNERKALRRRQMLVAASGRPASEVWHFGTITDVEDMDTVIVVCMGRAVCFIPHCAVVERTLDGFITFSWFGGYAAIFP